MNTLGMHAELEQKHKANYAVPGRRVGNCHADT